MITYRSLIFIPIGVRIETTKKPIPKGKKGYVFAFVGKFVLIAANAPQPWYETVHWYVMFFYVLNIAMVTTGIGIYFRNKHLDKKTVGVNKLAAVTE